MKGKTNDLKMYVDDDQAINADIRCVYLKEIRGRGIGSAGSMSGDALNNEKKEPIPGRNTSPPRYMNRVALGWDIP